jgi:hypothetical protein
VLLAATGRARERARRVPGDFADRLDRWLRGERPPPPAEHARKRSPLPWLTGGFLEARVEPVADGRLRVLLPGAEVGTVAAPPGTGAATVCAKVERTRRDAPLSLAVQLPSR